MLQLIAVLGILVAVVIALSATGNNRAARLIGFAVGVVVVAFAALVVFGLLFND